MSLKIIVLKWLGIDVGLNLTDMRRLIKNSIENDIRCENILEGKFSKTLKELFERTIHNNSEDSSVIIQMREIIKNLVLLEIQTVDKNIKNEVNEYVKSEEFIDRIVVRINTKQLKPQKE